MVASGYAERVQLPEESIVALGGDAGLDEERLLVSGADLLAVTPLGTRWRGRRSGGRAGAALDGIQSPTPWAGRSTSVCSDG